MQFAKYQLKPNKYHVIISLINYVQKRLTDAQNLHIFGPTVAHLRVCVELICKNKDEVEAHSVVEL